jgi:hypothetical protein
VRCKSLRQPKLRKIGWRLGVSPLRQAPLARGVPSEDRLRPAGGKEVLT